MKRFALLLSCLYLPFACELALADSPKDNDDAYSANRNMAATYKKSAEAADANETLGIKLAMARLLWPVDLGVLKPPADDQKFRDQIKALQSQMGVPATGNLTFGQEKILMRAAEFLFEHRVYGGAQKMVFASDDKLLVTADGSWSMEDMAYPINSTEISCWKPEKTCIVSSANLDLDDADTRLLAVSMEQYEIKSFSDTKIIAEREGFCGSSTLAIDVKAKTAKVVSVPNLVSDSCQKFRNSWMIQSEREKIHVMTLVNPWDASKKFFDVRKAEAEKLVYKPNLKVYEIGK